MINLNVLITQNILTSLTPRNTYRLTKDLAFQDKSHLLGSHMQPAIHYQWNSNPQSSIAIIRWGLDSTFI